MCINQLQGYIIRGYMVYALMYLRYQIRKR